MKSALQLIESSLIKHKTKNVTDNTIALIINFNLELDFAKNNIELNQKVIIHNEYYSSNYFITSIEYKKNKAKIEAAKVMTNVKPKQYIKN